MTDNDNRIRILEEFLDKANNRVFKLEYALYELCQERIKNADILAEQGNNNTIEDDLRELGLWIEKRPEPC